MRLLPAALCLAAGLSTARAADAPALTKLTVEPAQVTLTHAGDAHRLLVTGHFADGTQRDLTRSARFAADNASVAVFEQGVVTPKAAGEARVQVTANGQ